MYIIFWKLQSYRDVVNRWTCFRACFAYIKTSSIEIFGLISSFNRLTLQSWMICSKPAYLRSELRDFLCFRMCLATVDFPQWPYRQFILSSEMHVLMIILVMYTNVYFFTAAWNIYGILYCHYTANLRLCWDCFRWHENGIGMVFF